MAKTKERQVTLRGDQLLARGDVINISEGGSMVKCRVLSCLGVQGGDFVAGLEIIEGERAGERFTTRLRAGDRTDAASGEDSS